MSEFIKNNPSAIEVFLFYEGEKEKSNEKSYDKLCNLIGKNGISKENFNSLNEESRKKIRELVVSDPSNLRLCILSEVKNKNFMIESFLNITKIIGTQDIDYQDFEFWFNRFSSGNHDLDQKTFSDLPIEVIENIVEELDFLSQMKLRKVSHGLRNIMDERRPSYDRIYFSIECYYSHYFLSHLSICKFKGLESDRCWRRSYQGDDELKIALDGMQTLFSNPRLRLSTFDWYSASTEIDEDLSAILNSLNHKIEIVELETSLNGDVMVDLLKAVKPGTLEKIKFGGKFEPIHIERLAQLVQWKKAKSVSFWEFIPNFSSCMHHFQHFEFVSVDAESFSMDDILFVRNLFTQNNKLDYFDIGAGHIQSESKIVEILGRLDIDFNDEHWTRRYDIPGSKDYLKVIIRRERVYFVREISE
uniref:F-box domain-containing protein n=1 Tax=Caenorhabditis tropicalis TaxID=1561998 RepID=A0A1I7UI81_9PELO